MPATHTKKPTVAIVGRPNVGKSAIFNRFAGRRIAIVHDQPGVTRDRISAECSKAPIPFEVIDTGGIGATLDDGFGEQVRAEADIAIHAADLILFVVDGQTGIHPVDADLAKVLRKASVEVVLAVNKVDNKKQENAVTDFAGLGFDDPFAISAEHGINIDALTRHLGNRLIKRFGMPEEDVAESEEEGALPPVCIAMVGRPNVGKSSLINAILDDERTIVSDVAGTTRDAVDIPYERGGTSYNLIDTAGIRRRTKQDSSVEIFSVMRSERSIRRADLCLLVIDSATGVTAMDRKIARKILEENKPCLVILNKFDLFHPDGSKSARIEELREHVEKELFFLHYAPLVFTSALKGQYLNKIFGGIERVCRAARAQIGTGELNRVLKNAIEKNPAPARKNRRLNLLYATTKRSERPRAIDPPRFLLFVNHADLLSRTYERYLENTLRDAIDLTGLPVDFQVRSRRESKGG
ncbi:MAG: ribosome biogenesis GTPase Der [Verrucomicrobiota bacterium]